MVTPRWAPPRLGTTELQVRIGDSRNAAAAEGVGAGLCAVRRLRSVTVCNVVPATSTCCLGTQWTPLADCGEGSSVAEPECQKDPSAWLCKQRIVHLRPNSASASPSGVGRERLKRCLTFWTACGLQQASPSPRASRVPVQPIAATQTATRNWLSGTVARRWGPCISWLPVRCFPLAGHATVTVYLSLCLSLHHYWYVAPKELRFGQGRPSFPDVIVASSYVCVRFLRRPSVRADSLDWHR